MKKQELAMSRIDLIHSMNYLKNGKYHKALKDNVDKLIRKKMIRWTTQEFMQVIDHLTKKNSGLQNIYFAKSDYIAYIKKEIAEHESNIMQNEFWTDKEQYEEKIFYLTKILEHMDPKYVNIKSPKEYTQWYDNYDYKRVNDFIISIMAHFDSIDEFEEELQGLMGNFDCNKKMLHCVRKYKRNKIIREILE